MTREKFIIKLCERLKSLDDNDIERACEFYSEMISERMEEGLSEEDAIDELGSLDYIEAQIKESLRNEVELKRNIEVNEVSSNDKKHKDLEGWQIALLILGFPVWFSLLIALLSICLSVYIVIWAVVGASYVADIALGIGGVSTVIAAFGFLFTGNASPGFLSLGEGLLLIGGALILFIALKYITRLGSILTRKFTELLRKIILGGRTNA